MTCEIVTVTLNPAIDRTVAVDRLTLGAVHRARSSLSNAGGKGVNVAGCLADWGLRPIVTGILGRDNAAPFEAFFAAKGIDDRFVRAAGETRTNIKIADLATGETTDLNLPGLHVSTATYDAVWETLRAVVRPTTLVVVAGSLPENLPVVTLAALVSDLTRLGARVVLDTSGEPLARALAPEVRHLPFAVKPNRAELEDFAGRPLAGEAEIAAAARALVERGLGLVVVSRGADGAIFVTAEAALTARLPPVTALSTVGAGDAMVAGMVAGLAEAAPLERIARLGVAFAAAKLADVGPNLPSVAAVRELAAAVTLRPVD
ncbi:MAG: 1-phosphofructokinase [Siculibacillus sp.]|nr:1-phosphofructokinase [Siculibacillus sp.]